MNLKNKNTLFNITVNALLILALFSMIGLLIRSCTYDTKVAAQTSETSSSKYFSYYYEKGNQWTPCTYPTTQESLTAESPMVSESSRTEPEITKKDITTLITTSEKITTVTSTLIVTSRPPMLTSPQVPEKKLVSLGVFKLTAYCPCKKCCGKWAETRPVDKNGNPIIYTASGNLAREGFTIAADISVLPFGTKVYINGHEYEVQDVGGAVKGNSIDIYFASHEAALNFGLQYSEVFIKK